MRAAVLIAILVAIALALVFLLQTGGGGSPVPGGEVPPGTGTPMGEEAVGQGVDAERVEVPVRPGPEALPPDATVSGRILDADSGGSLAGAEVWVEGAPGGLLATTEGGGEYFLPLQREELRGLAVGARREGYLAARRTLLSKDVGSDGHARSLDLALWPMESTARITGRVVTGDGSAATGSVVTLREQEDPTRNPEDGDPFHLEVEVDAFGAFDLAPLPPTPHVLEVQCEGFQAARISARSLPRGSTTDVGTLVLSRSTVEEVKAAALFGTVLDGDGQPADAMVRYNPGYADMVRVPVDSTGAFELPVTPGDRRVLGIEVAGQPMSRARSFGRTRAAPPTTAAPCPCKTGPRRRPRSPSSSTNATRSRRSRSCSPRTP